MVVKKKAKKESNKSGKAKVSIVNKVRPAKEEKEEEEVGMSLDDAFGDDEDVEYAESKPAKIKKKAKMDEDDEEELEEELDEIQADNKVEQGPVKIKSSKPISKIKKDDKIMVDGVTYNVDAHYVLIDHGSTKEMAIELYNDKDQDFQLRYFDDQVESTIEFYELKEILYVKKAISTLSW